MFLFSEGYQPLLVPRWAQGTRAAAHLLGILPRKFLLRDQWQGFSGVRGHSMGTLSILFSLSLTQGQCGAHGVSKLICGSFLPVRFRGSSARVA